MKAITEANPESSENTGETNQSRSKPTCLDTYSPQSSYECVGSKYLQGYVSCVLNSSKEMTHKGDQGHPKLAYLLDDALCCTIRSRCDDSNMSPSDIEDTTQRLQNIEEKKGELSHDSNQLVGQLYKVSSRPCKRRQAPVTASSHHLEAPFYIEGYFSVQHSVSSDRRKKEGRTYTD